MSNNYYYYYAAFNAPCVGHKDDDSQAHALLIIKCALSKTQAIVLCEKIGDKIASEHSKLEVHNTAMKMEAVLRYNAQRFNQRAGN